MGPRSLNVLCPDCGEDTNPTLKFCQFCNSPLEFDMERLGAALSQEAPTVIRERIERQARGYLYMSIFILVSVIAARMILVKPIPMTDSPSFYAPSEAIGEINPPLELELKLEKYELPKGLGGN